MKQKMMRRHFIFTFLSLLMIVFWITGGHVQGQSEHAKKKALEFKATHPDYVKDILVSKPDFIVYAPKVDLKKLGDTYNDHFQVFDKPDGKLFAVWTQATREGYVDHHIAFSRSFDKGLTWSAPQVLAGSANNVNPQLNASWQQPMVSRTGRIYVFWNQQVSNTKNQHCGEMFGCYSDNDGDTWSAPRKVEMGRTLHDTGTDDPTPMWCNWQRPLRLGREGRYLVASSRHRMIGNPPKYHVVTEFLQFDNIDDNPKVEDVKLSWFMSSDKALIWDEGFSSTCEEAGLVKLPDGRLFAMMRTAAGYPIWSTSSDHGVTWQKPKPLRNRDGGTIYKHPRSPCPIYDQKGPEAGSGLYFAFVHNTFDPKAKNEWQNRGPLYLLPGTYQPKAEQPIWFGDPILFIDRPSGNSFYTSSTVVNGKTVLWYNDKKYYLLGRYIELDNQKK